MNIDTILVQASSRSWSGGPDRSISRVGADPVIVHTLRRLREVFSTTAIRIIAPEFDKGGELDQFARRTSNCLVSYSHDASPFDRIVAQTEHQNDGYVLRIDALNFCFIKEHLDVAQELAKSGAFDVIKFHDDFPAQLTFEIYKASAIKKLKQLILADGIDEKLLIHSKFAYYLYKKEFSIKSLDQFQVSEIKLLEIREAMKSLYDVDRIEVEANYIASGDQIRFHYDRATNWMNRNDKVLDIACGNGFGARIMSEKAGQVIGGDLDSHIISLAEKTPGNPSNISFKVEDVTKMTFADASFDVVTSMETIEHLKPLLTEYFKEIRRVLRPGGQFILSTPQNSMGNIPLNSAHGIEFDRTELVNLVNVYFQVVEVISIKAGCIVFEEDPHGNNMMIRAIKT